MGRRFDVRRIMRTPDHDNDGGTGTAGAQERSGSSGRAHSEPKCKPIALVASLRAGADITMNGKRNPTAERNCDNFTAVFDDGEELVRNKRVFADH